MKVLQVIPSLSEFAGGPTIALEEIERSLTERGLRVETVTTDDGGPGTRNGKICGSPILENGVQRRYFQKRTEFYKAAPSLGRWLRKHIVDYDIVHVHALFSYASVSACQWARRRSIPYIVRPLGTLAHYGITQRRPWLKRLSLDVVERPLLEAAAAVHFTSGAELVEAQRLNMAMRPVVVPLGIRKPQAGDAARLLRDYPLMADALRIVYLSRLDPKKNLEGLIRALGITTRRGLAAAVLVGGSGEPGYVARLKALAVAEGVADRVVWLGHVQGARKADLLAAGEVFALPSISENFGIAVVEALAAGLPCILGDGIALAVEVESAGAGIGVAPSADAIAAALEYYAKDPSLRIKHGLAARQLYARSFSIETMGANLEALYCRVLHETGRVQARA